MSKGVGYQLLNFLAIICLLASLIGDFLLNMWVFTYLLIGIFKIFTLLILVIIEVKQLPGLVKPFSFLFYFFGRGLFYIFFGFLTMSPNILTLIANFVMVAIGFVYIIIHLVNRNNEPEYMSFEKYRQLTNDTTPILPTTAPVVDQEAPAPQQEIVPQQEAPLNQQEAPLTQQEVSPQQEAPSTQRDTAVPQEGATNINVPENPSSPVDPESVHVESQGKTEV